jgi:serine/threonine-protein kinase
MAEVFKGVAESLQGFRKNVAIKRVLPALTKNTKFVTMFLDEARLSLFLQHANIVQVFDIGHADDTYFIVMEYVDGVDLKAILEWRRRIGRRLTIGQTIYITMELCKGLNYAHELTHPETGARLGIVHRDVSPANVLLSRNGEVKLADFGLAKAASQVESTDPGVVKGKMSYLSPEAARGENVDHRSDIFSVGILLYEMLTGKRLFYGDTDYQTVELVRNAKIPPISAQNPEVEPEFEDICRKALARRTEDRFQSATDLQDALAHYQFSRGLKMIQRDISEMVRSCLEDQATLSTGTKAKRAGAIDTILHAELNAFTSLDFENATPPPQEDGKVAAPMDSQGDPFIDPRAWSTEADWPGRRTSGRRDTTGDFFRRDTSAVPTRDTLTEIPTRVTVPTAIVQPPPPPPTSSTKAAPPPMPAAAAAQAQLPAQVQLPAQEQLPAQGYAPLPDDISLRPKRGKLYGVLAAALVAGAIVIWLILGGR